MSEFELFNEMFLNSLKIEDEKNTVCIHINKTDMSGTILCTDCGEEIDKIISHDKEWRYYGQSDTKHVSDPNRCQLRRVDDKSIFKDVDSMGFSDKIITIANKLYTQVTGGKIHRGNSRKAIVFACVFHAYKLNGKPQACETLIEIFNLDRKTGLRGLKHVNLNVNKESVIHTHHITPANLIEDIMNKFSASDEQKKEVTSLYDRVKNKSSKINRSRPQSIAAGITYYWICDKNKQISLKEFTEKVNISELTILRISKEIAHILI